MKLSGEDLEHASIAGVQGPGKSIVKIMLKRGFGIILWKGSNTRLYSLHS